MTGDFDDHLDKLERVLARLQEAGLKINANKSFFARTELEYLGYWITREGIQPLPKKVEAIQCLKEPRTKKELRGFIGLVNYYRDMWIRRSHVLAPLASLTSKTVKWQWGPEQSEAFQKMKRIIAKETLLAYPNFDKPFVIHTDASHHQLGAVISQDRKPIVFYSRKLKPEQTWYTTTERELLSIVETLKEFRNILLGHRIIVHTDHKNLTCKNFNTERVIRWRLILEEYGPELLYIKGEKNIVADALSRLNLMTLEEFQEQYHIEPTSEAMSELFAGDEDDVPDSYPLVYRKIYDGQQADQELQDAYLKSDEYSKRTFKHSDKEFELITWKGKICLPKNLQKRATEWYHSLLYHPGETRMELTIGQHFHWKNMRKTIQRVCRRCAACQETKDRYVKKGLLPIKDPEVIPWKTLCIDLIGPYTFGKPPRKVRGKIIDKQVKLHCLTMIDPATGWFEIIEINDTKADYISNKLEQAWLTRYPWPEEVVLDRGKEFMAEVRTMLRDEYGITRKPITTRNPQANAMVERAHKTIHQMIRSQQIRDSDDLPPDDQWSGILAAVGFSMRATVHTTTLATPAQLVFNRDAMHNVSFVAELQYI